MNDLDLHSLGRAIERQTTPPRFSELTRRGARRRRRRRLTTTAAGAVCVAVLAYATASYTDVLGTSPREPAKPPPETTVTAGAVNAAGDSIPREIDMSEATFTVGQHGIDAFGTVPEFAPDLLQLADLRIEVRGKQREYLATIQQSRTGELSTPKLTWAGEMMAGKRQPCSRLRIEVEQDGVYFDVPKSCLPEATNQVRFQIGYVSYKRATDKYQEASDLSAWVDLD